MMTRAPYAIAPATAPGSGPHLATDSGPKGQAQTRDQALTSFLTSDHASESEHPQRDPRAVQKRLTERVERSDRGGGQVYRALALRR